MLAQYYAVIFVKFSYKNGIESIVYRYFSEKRQKPLYSHDFFALKYKNFAKKLTSNQSFCESTLKVIFFFKNYQNCDTMMTICEEKIHGSLGNSSKKHQKI